MRQSWVHVLRCRWILNINIFKRIYFGNICVTEHIGSRNLKRLMTVAIEQTAMRKNLQNAGMIVVRVEEKLSEANPFKRSKLFRNLSKGECAALPNSHSFAVLTILKTRPK